MNRRGPRRPPPEPPPETGAAAEPPLGAELRGRKAESQTEAQEPGRGDSSARLVRGDFFTPSEADRALCRSALYEALALGLRPPTSETLTRLASPEGAAALADAAAILDEAWGSTLAPLARQLAQPCILDGLTASFDRLFGHTARGTIPPYETEYGADSLFQPMHEMSDLAAFYRAFGLRLHPEAHERPDHVSCECEFLAFLARKEAYARDHEDEAMLDATQGATRRFVRDHPGRWMPAFGRMLARQDPGGFFGNLGRLCAGFITGECARLGVAAGPEFLRVRSAAMPDLPAACGLSADLLRRESPKTQPGLP